jgi:DNA-binding NtrC family response regulator
VANRVVASDIHDLRRASAQGTFHPDLFDRLDVASIRMPPLREMPEVVPQLVIRFAAELADRFQQASPWLLPADIAELLRYDWPGNVRELRNAVERALIFHDGGRLRVRPPGTEAPGDPGAGVLMPPGLTLDEVQRRYLLAALQGAHGDYASLATRLGISRKTLWDKRRRLGLGARDNGAAKNGKDLADA